MQGFLFLSTPFLIFLQDLKLFITNSFLKFLPALASIPLHSLCFLPLFLYTHCLLPLILFSDHCKHVSMFILQPILDYLLLTIFFSWFWEKIPWLQQSLQVNDFKSYISITIFFFQSALLHFEVSIRWWQRLLLPMHQYVQNWICRISLYLIIWTSS